MQAVAAYFVPSMQLAVYWSLELPSRGLNVTATLTCAATQAQIHYPMLDMSGIPVFLDKLAGEPHSYDMRTLSV